MTRATYMIAATAVVCIAAAPPVTFESPCQCRDNHGKTRLAVKEDPATPPADASAIQAVTPSNIFSWPGPDVHAVKVEIDVDFHIALQDATGDKTGIVVCEIPAKQQW